MTTGFSVADGLSVIVYILFILSSTPLLQNAWWEGAGVRPFVEWGNFIWQSELIHSKDAVNWCDIRESNDFGIPFGKNQDCKCSCHFN